MAAFDWYQATIPAPVDDVLEALCGLDERVELKHTRGMHGYGTSTRLEGHEGLLAQVWHGGKHAHPHAVISGENAQPGSELIRANFPLHLVTRLDAKEDFEDPDAFDRMQAVLLGVATTRRIKVDARGDHFVTKQGRTINLGASSSACSARLYEKAAQLRARFAADPVRLAAVPEHLTRFEAEVHPQTREAKEHFSTIEPLAVMGSSPWLRDVWHGLVGQHLTPVQVGKKWRQSDDDRAYAFLLAQYGGLLERIKADSGSWECVGLQIGHDLVERAKAKRGIR